MSVIQIPLLIWAAHTQDWMLFVALLAVMVFVFGSIPFTDAMIVRYVDDRLRSRVAGMRLIRPQWGSRSLAQALMPRPRPTQKEFQKVSDEQ